MNEITEMQKTITAATEPTIAPSHRDWMDTQIEKSLAHSKSGEATHKTLDQIVSKYGLDAR